jgi:hypothetical protein
MAGYILARLPGVDSVELDLQGEIQNNRFSLAPASGAEAPPPAPSEGPGTAPGGGLSRLQAMEQAGEDVTKVFKMGKAWRYSVFDHAAGHWVDSPLIATEEEAARLRQEALKERFDALLGGARAG